MGAHVRLAGPDYDEHVALNPQEEEEPPLFYYKDDPNRDSRSVRGCFLDEIYAKPRLEQKLADLYFDGDVPFMRDNVHQLTDAQWRCFFEGYLVEPLPRKERKYAVVFYGVSGYTGSLVMEYLKRECLDDVSVCFAGRTLHKVIKMRDKVLAGTRWANCDCVSCDLKEPFEVEALVSSCRVVCNIAGPFMYHGVGITESGKKVCWSIKGRDGYFETARMAVEAALAMSESGDELRSGSESVRGGVLTPGIAGKHVLFDRIRAAGMDFIDWSPGTSWDGVKPDDRLGVDVWGNKAAPPPVPE